VPNRWSLLDPVIARHIARALHPDPKKRFASCGDFREALAEHLHGRYPGAGVRGIRDTMAELFAEEIRREREHLSRFGRVTVAGFRTSFDETRSQSISLARADETEGSGTTLVRDERSAPLARADGPSGSGRDLHREPTRLMAREQTDIVAPKGRSTAEGPHGDVTVVRFDDAAPLAQPADTHPGTGELPAAPGVIAPLAATASPTPEHPPRAARPVYEPTMRVQRAPRPLPGERAGDTAPTATASMAPDIFVPTTRSAPRILVVGALAFFVALAGVGLGLRAANDAPPPPVAAADPLGTPGSERTATSAAASTAASTEPSAAPKEAPPATTPDAAARAEPPTHAEPAPPPTEPQAAKPERTERPAAAASLTARDSGRERPPLRRPDKPDRPDRTDRTDRADQKTEKTEKTEKIEKTEKHERREPARDSTSAADAAALAALRAADLERRIKRAEGCGACYVVLNGAPIDERTLPRMEECMKNKPQCR
jgi:hypothetical protein